MLLLIGFAFLAGIVTVLSPCILPVLPVILSGSVGGGKARPWGIITGFTVSFTVFTLTLSSLVQAFGIDPDVLRWVAAALILGFGVVLVVPVLKDAFMAWTTALVSRSTTVKTGKPAGGYWSGVVLGLGLGLVWTPCVGPIMASVISLALSQAVDASSVFITLAYTLGTALPLFLIMQGGRSLLNRFPWFTTHASGIQRGFGVLMMVTALALFTGADRAFSTWILTTFPSYGTGLTSLEDQQAVKDELEKRRSSLAPAAAATDADPLTLGEGEWLNSAPLTLAGLKGKVVLVDFWTYSCINCVRTMPYLKAWYEKYRDQGLVIVGVHSPEFAFERSATNLKRAMGELGVTWPVVQDNAFGIWTAFQNQYWPAHYLYDREGNLIETHFGEGNYAETEAAIAKALGATASVNPSEPVTRIAISDGPKTPETYLGYGRGARFASPEDVATDAPSAYSIPGSLKPDSWALGGRWTIGQQSSQGVKGSRLSLNFQGARVYLVMSPGEGSTTVQVTLDGNAMPALPINSDAMYTLVDEAHRTGGLLELEFDGPVQVFAFTFG